MTLYAIISKDPVLIGEPDRLWSIIPSNAVNTVLGALESSNPDLEFDVLVVPEKQPLKVMKATV